MGESGGRSVIHHFEEKLAWSRGIRQATDKAAIERMIPGCVSVCDADEDMDRAGIDYIARLRRGAVLYIDAKRRRRGCSRYWREGPEFALEIWSVLPGGKYGIPRDRAKTGWTLCEKKDTDLIFFAFDTRDSDEVFLIGFQHLRMAFRAHIREWMENYKVDVQDSERWESQCVYVPATVVLEAVRHVSQGSRIRLFWDEFRSERL